MNVHTHKQFDTEMEAIRSGVLAMGGRVEAQLTRAMTLLDDDEERDAIDQVGADEKLINQMQVNLDQMCSQIIARRQPTAIDLRFVLMITRSSTSSSASATRSRRSRTRPRRFAARTGFHACGITK
jgi:phosphate transport system protein